MGWMGVDGVGGFGAVRVGESVVICSQGTRGATIIHPLHQPPRASKKAACLSYNTEARAGASATPTHRP